MPTTKDTAPAGATSRSDSIRKIAADLTGDRLLKLLDDQRLMLFNDAANALELPSLEDEASRLAHQEETGRRDNADEKGLEYALMVVREELETAAGQIDGALGYLTPRRDDDPDPGCCAHRRLQAFIAEGVQS